MIKENHSEHNIKAFIDGVQIFAGPANIVTRKNNIEISNFYSFSDFDQKKNFNAITNRFEKKVKNRLFELEILKN